MNDETQLHKSLLILTKLADKYTDGQFSIFKDRNGWKVMFDFPELSHQGRQEIQHLVGAENLHEAVRICCLTHQGDWPNLRPLKRLRGTT